MPFLVASWHFYVNTYFPILFSNQGPPLPLPLVKVSSAFRFVSIFKSVVKPYADDRHTRPAAIPAPRGSNTLIITISWRSYKSFNIAQNDLIPLSVVLIKQSNQVLFF